MKLILTLLALAIQGQTKMASDEAQILQLEKEFMAAWNEGNAKGAAAVYADDGLRVGAFGDIARGRKEIEAAYERLLHGPMKGAKASYEAGVRFLAPEIALVEGALTITPPQGEPIRGYVVEIWKKTGGRWQLIEGHPKLFPPRK